MTVGELRELPTAKADDDEVHVLQSDGTIVRLEEVNLDPALELDVVLVAGQPDASDR